MTDKHLRVLRDIVRHRVEMLDRHRPRPAVPDAGSLALPTPPPARERP